jgi:hypothetical protein
VNLLNAEGALLFKRYLSKRGARQRSEIGSQDFFELFRSPQIPVCDENVAGV